MLKIKDSVDLKELKKFGYKLGRDGLCIHRVYFNAWE